MSITPIEVSKKKNKKQYFTQETEDAIIKYNSISDSLERSILYEREIHYAFFKLTQNLIHTFKFYYTDVEDIEDLQHELIEFLLTKIHLFHHSRSINDRLNKIINKTFKEPNKYPHHDYKLNLDVLTPGSFSEYTNNSPKITQQQINDFLSRLDVSEECLYKLKGLTPPKAFSYFGTIAKRWLILYNEGNYKKKLDKVDINELDNNTPYFSPTNNDLLFSFMEKYISFCYSNLDQIFQDKLNKQIADAVLELFIKRNNLLSYNKKALYISIRERVSAKTNKITSVVKVLEKIFSESYIYYIEHGVIKFKIPQDE